MYRRFRGSFSSVREKRRVQFLCALFRYRNERPWRKIKGVRTANYCLVVLSKSHRHLDVRENFRISGPVFFAFAREKRKIRPDDTDAFSHFLVRGAVSRVEWPSRVTLHLSGQETRYSEQLCKTFSSSGFCSSNAFARARSKKSPTTNINHHGFTIDVLETQEDCFHLARDGETTL